MHHDRLGGEEGVMGRGGYEKEKEREKGEEGSKQLHTYLQCNTAQTGVIDLSREALPSGVQFVNCLKRNIRGGWKRRV